MDVPSQVSEKELLLPPPPPPPYPRPALITPSVSPPGSRITHRIPDRPPPPKRVRTSATPSRSTSTAYSSDQHRSLFAFWDQLAERYNKPLDQDDIVDLRRLEFLKDRGVTRSAPQVYEIGCFMDAGEGSSEATEGEESEEESEAAPPEEVESDELDLLGSLQRYKDRHVPPVDAANPEDAEAFREFEEAERRRRELFGDEEEEYTVDGHDGPSGMDATTDDGEDPELDDALSADYSVSSKTPTDDTGEVERVLSPSPILPTPRRKSRSPAPLVADDTSEDELATWEIDDTPIPPRRSEPPTDDIIDLTESRSPSPVRRSRAQSQSRARSRGVTRARSQSRPSAKADSVSRGQLARTSRRSPPSPLQLLTPPRSSCSVPDLPPPVNEAPVRVESPSPTMPRPRPRYVPRSRSRSTEAVKGTQESPAKLSDASGSLDPSSSAVKLSKSRMRAEVLITIPSSTPKRVKATTSDVSPDVPLSEALRVQRNNHKNTMPSAAKMISHHQSPEPPVSKLSAAGFSQDVPSAREEVAQESCSPQPIPPRGRKRRRVSSSPSEDDLWEKVVGSPPISASVGRRKAPQRTIKRASGYHSDTAPPTSSPARSVDESDDIPPMHSGRSVSRARSEAPIPSLPLYPPMYPPFSPQQLESSASSGPAHRADSAHPPHLSYHPHMAPHPAHIMAWMSYFMASGALPLPHALPPSAPGFPPSVPTPFYGHPSTPTHSQPRQNSHNRDPNPPSSEAGPSRSAYSTPAHQAYPFWFNPGYSSGTLPPSSPVPSSPIDSSPALRPASVPSGQRSKARGRRVSFKLQTQVRPLSSTPSPDADERGSNVRVGQSDDKHVSDERPRGRSRSRGRRECTPKIPTSGKGKGKARAIYASDASDDGDEDADRQDPIGRAGPDHGRPPPRARTPGPPSRREQSVPRGSSRSNEKTSAKRK